MAILFGAGFNAHGQISGESSGEDVRAFHPITHDENTEVLFAGWSTTVLASPTQGIWSLGHQKIQGGGAFTFSGTRPGSQISAFGDHEGLRGLLRRNDGSGGSDVYNTEPVGDDENGCYRLTLLTTSSSPSISHLALAGNDRVAVTFTQAPRGRLCHVVEFESLSRFAAWYGDPSGDGMYPDAHHMLPGRPKCIVAGTAIFGLLMEDGEVYSWGDARLGSLGRTTVGDGVDANQPGMMEALGGLKVTKLVTGGWLSAALSADGALYLWGAMMPGFEGTIRCLQEAGPGEVVLVQIPPEDGDHEPLDVVDVAVGDNHVAVITADHRLWMVGDNTHGQLSVDSEGLEFLEDWAECTVSQPAVQRVYGGPKATFVQSAPG